MDTRTIALRIATAFVVAAAVSGAPADGRAAQSSDMLASGDASAPTDASAPAASPDRPLTPAEIMARRFPQPVRVGYLVGLPVYDEWDQTLGHITGVVRSDQGQISLIVPFGGWFGWGDRPVAVPIETVAILGDHVNAMEFTRKDFEAAPTWTPGQGQALAANDSIKIALGRR